MSFFSKIKKFFSCEGQRIDGQGIRPKSPRPTPAQLAASRKVEIHPVNFTDAELDISCNGNSEMAKLVEGSFVEFSDGSCKKALYVYKHLWPHPYYCPYQLAIDCGLFRYVVGFFEPVRCEYDKVGTSIDGKTPNIVRVTPPKAPHITQSYIDEMEGW